MSSWLEKKNAEQTLDIAKLMTKRKIEDRYSMVKGITDCQSLGEIKDLVDSLINDYGIESKVNFDSGYNNIIEEIVTFREETSDEVNARIDKEIQKLTTKELNLKKQGSVISAEIQSLINLKTQ